METKATILCVDDEEKILNFVRRLLSLQGYEVLTATSGEEALTILADRPVDVIITDQRMPGMSGTEFLRASKDVCPSARRIMMSGYSDFGSLVDAVNEGELFRFIAKPCESEQLTSAVRLALFQRDFSASLQQVVQDVAEFQSLGDAIECTIQNDDGAITLNVGHLEEIVPKPVVAKLLRMLFDQLGSGKHFQPTSWLVSRDSGRASIVLTVEDGIDLKVQLPPTE